MTGGRRMGMKSPLIPKSIMIFPKFSRVSLGSCHVIFPSKTGLLMKHIINHLRSGSD